MNYARPNSEEDDEPEDWLMSALAFTGALSNLLKDGEGVVVKAKNDLLELLRKNFPDWEGTTISVYKSNHQIHIDVCDESLEEGQLLWVHDVEDDIRN